MNKEIKIDCHVHSADSKKDSVALIGNIIDDVTRRKELDGIAITDHNTIGEEVRILSEGFNPPFIIRGEEILTLNKNPSGKEIEIVGMFLQETIAPGQTIEETIYQIDAQKGLVVFPHPFDLWRHGAGREITKDIIENYCLPRRIPVAIEVLNARSREIDFTLATLFWLDLFKDGGVLRTAGSDAHRIPEIGRAYVRIRPFQTKGEFLGALAQAEIYGKVNNLETIRQRLLNRIEVNILRHPLSASSF